MTEMVRVIDTETTGLAAEDQIVELAAVMVDGSRDGNDGIAAYWHTLAQPHVPIKLDAMATHHITSRMLERQPGLADVRHHTRNLEAAISSWADWPLRTTVLAGHNLAFDVKMLLQSGWLESDLPERRICTYRCARHIWPDCPSHKNQTLRYYLELWDVLHGDPPHRALADAMVTAQILLRMLETHTVDELVHMTNQPIPMDVCRFGKPHRGKPWKDVPTDYLRWMTRLADLDDDLRHHVQRELERRR